MDWILQLTKHDWTALGVAAAAFVLGFVFARFVHGSRRIAVTGEDRRDRRIRELEVDLRLTERKLEDAEHKLESTAEEFDQSMATVVDLNALLEERDSQVQELRSEVKGAVRKTRELRRELTERAEETMREHVRAKEARDELDVMRAGSDALVTEFERVQQETESENSDS
ncbi:MAG: hypothetical protein HKN56_08945 [Gammaproteobacteria bacterium]|nr:hypothetical protein [Gammaproteobacteria bacterium]